MTGKPGRPNLTKENKELKKKVDKLKAALTAAIMAKEDAESKADDLKYNNEKLMTEMAELKDVIVEHSKEQYLS